MPILNDVLVITELEHEDVNDVSLELLGKGRRIADMLGSNMCAAILTDSAGRATQTIANHRVDKIYVIEDPLLSCYSVEFFTDALSDLVRDVAPKIVLFGATAIGCDLAPRLAARLGSGFVSKCISIDLDGDDLLLTKATHGGQVRTTYRCSSQFRIATFEPEILEVRKSDTGEKAEIVKLTTSLNPARQMVNLIDVTRLKSSEMNLDEADVIVAGGKGMGNATNFALLEDLADALGGCVAGTRMAVDAGWISSDRLVGQTGNTVRPKLYVACGISGALHHTLGMKDANKVVAINTDANAPIFKIADMGIVGNVLEVIPNIIEQLQEYKKAT